MAGAQGSGLQRGQDADRPPRRGFDFLGFNVRRYRRQAADQTQPRRPSGGSGNGSRTEMRALRGSNAAAVIAALNPDHPGLGGLLPGCGVEARCSHAWTTTCGSSPTNGPRYSHPNKPKRWIVGRYFGKFNKFRNDRWVFGDRDSGAYLVKFAWTDIVRHMHGQGQRRPPTTPPWPSTGPSGARRIKPPLDSYTLRLLTRQDGRCPLCGDYLLPADQRTSQPPRVGAMVAAGHPQGDQPGTTSSTTGDPAHRTRQPASCTPPATAGQPAATQEPSSPATCNRPRGLLEPMR